MPDSKPGRSHHINGHGVGAALRLAFRPLFGRRNPNDEGKDNADHAIDRMKEAAVALKTVAQNVQRVTKAQEDDPLVVSMRRLSEKLGR